LSNIGEPSNNTKNLYGWQVKKPVILPKKSTSAQRNRVDMEISKLENLLAEHAVRVRVFRTSFCPNIKSIDGAEHNLGCTICNGSGLIDRHPICTHSFLQTQTLQPHNFPEGWVLDNAVAATFPIGIELFYFTLVELMDYTEIFTQNVQRQTATPDVLKYSACRVNFIMGSNGVEYYQERDFNIDNNGSIVWVTGRGPTTGSIYTIHYEAAVQFRAIRALHSNRFVPVDDGAGIKQVKGPEQWILQKEFLVRRNDFTGTELPPNKINPI